MWTTALMVYAGGVLLGLILVDERFPGRLGVAAIWPLGPIAFLVTITVLLLALPVAMPRVALGLAVAGATMWWIWTRLG